MVSKKPSSFGRLLCFQKKNKKKCIASRRQNEVNHPSGCLAPRSSRVHLKPEVKIINAVVYRVELGGRGGGVSTLSAKATLYTFVRE